MAFVYCADNNVFELLFVSIASLRRFTNEDIIILDDGISEDNKKTIQDSITNINFINVSNILKEKISDSNEIDRKITKVSMAWILIPDILSEYDKVAVIDCDTLIQSEKISEYKTIDMENKTFAAVPEKISSYSFKKRYQFDWLVRTGVGFFEHSKILGLRLEEYDEYVNSGFVIIDIKKMIQNGYLEKMLKWHSNNLKRPFNDQDILNSVAKNDIKKLPVFWNYCKPTFGSYWPYFDIENFNKFSNKAIIIHYAGKFAKPISSQWDGTYPKQMEYIEIYEKYIKSK